MQIGLVTADFHPNVGGVAAHVVELGRALVQLGHSVHVVTLPLGEEREPLGELHGMTVHRPPIPKGKPIYSWMLGSWLRSFVQKTQLDALHVHGLRPLEASRSVDVPVVFTNHTSGFLKRVAKGRLEKQRMKWRLSHVQHVLAPSDELVEATKSVGYEGPVHFISNGVDTDRFLPGQPTMREAWNVGDNETAVLLARRLVEKNGVTVFADAVTRLKQKNVRIIFAGDGAERSTVEKTLRDGGMHDRCVFLGNVPNPDMPDIYRSADLSVLPSFMEATSITGLESMATGLPLVGTRVGGIPVLIQDGETGLLVEPRDPAGLAEAMDMLIGDPARRKEMGEQARQRAVEQFAWTRIADETAQVYSNYARRAA